MSRPSWMQLLIGTNPGVTSFSGTWIDYPSTASNVCGDGLFLNQGGVYRFLSSHCIRVIETDATLIKVERYISGTIADSEYGCGAILSGPVGARYGTSLVCRLTAPVGTTGARTTVHALPPGTKRIFVVGGAQSGSIGQHVQSVSFPLGASVTEIAEPSTGTLVVDGFGSLRFANDGFVVSAGVLSSSAPNISLRAAYTARVAKLAPTEVLCGAGTNTLSDGVSASDYQVVLDAWITATWAGAPGARLVLLSPFRRPSLEGSTAPGFRAATQAVASARGVTYVDGLAVLDAGDLSADLIHPKRRAQSKIAAAVLANTSTAYRTMLYVDSIISGSCDPQCGTGYTGPVHMIRAARG